MLSDEETKDYIDRLVDLINKREILRKKPNLTNEERELISAYTVDIDYLISSLVCGFPADYACVCGRYFEHYKDLVSHIKEGRCLNF